jgi:hypothetical protein
VNALTEIKDIEDIWAVNIIAARIEFGAIAITLHVGHSPGERDSFNKLMDREYDEGYGTQELFGTLWFCDGGWAERKEYDGAEAWRVCTVPELPERKV